MNTKTLTEIDYFRIRDQIAGFCISEEGREGLLKRFPLIDRTKIEGLKNLSREWNVYFSVASQNPLLGWEPVGKLFSIIKTNGAALSLDQVSALGHFVLSSQSLVKNLNIHKDELGLKNLGLEADKLPEFDETAAKIFRVITSDGQIRELPEIAAIRKEIANLHSKIRGIMQKFTSDQKFSNILESNLPALKNGRQVLAVKASFQNRIPGIIHEVSQSSHTVFIEPQDAVLASNELVEKEFELQAVIKKILMELTQSLQPSIPLFRQALPVLCNMDATQAAARWGASCNCNYALEARGEPPLLLQARHPLLGDRAVPIDIRFMDGKRVLIITGPNTGGKTVSLKTFALLAMLNQSGFPIPAGEGTRLPVFGNVFADIGDDQSLDQSLSTFSGHMKNIAEAVRHAKSDTLILLDELGSGTDPQEGTAISMAVLDELIKRQSFVLVTTHQGVLKNYGYTNPSCVNASVEFDQNTLSPSYRLLMGVPGESHALDIAKKNGLPQEICKAARNYIATEQADVSGLIRGLNRKHLELNKIQKEMEKRVREEEEKEERLKAKELEIRRRENDLKKEKTQELNDFLIHSRRQLENLVREVREGELTREKTLGVKSFINELTKETARLDSKVESEAEKLAADKEKFEKELQKKKHPSSNKKSKGKKSNAEALKTAVSLFADEEGGLAGGGFGGGGLGNGGASFGKSAAALGKMAAGAGSASGSGGKMAFGAGSAFSKKSAPQALVFAPGARVKTLSTGNEGVLVQLARKGLWTVQFGSVKMNVKEKELKLLPPSQAALEPSVSYELAGYSDFASTSLPGAVIEKEIERPVFELRLLGMYAEEARKALEHQIDLCILNNFLHFSVIHGKGDGVLRQMVKDFLSNNPVVESFEEAPAEDGGAGKTYVSLK